MVKRLLTLFTIIVVLAAGVWGILWLEDMRKQAAQEARDNTEAALKPEVP